MVSKYLSRTAFVISITCWGVGLSEGLGLIMREKVLRSLSVFHLPYLWAVALISLAGLSVRILRFSTCSRRFLPDAYFRAFSGVALETLMFRNMFASKIDKIILEVDDQLVE